MKKILHIVFIFFAVSEGNSQVNLVMNPSFEEYSSCPNNQGQVDYVTGWDIFGNSPDYFNSCSANPDFSIPNNWGGYQLPSSGEAYVAFSTYSPCCPDLREYLSSNLISPLQENIKYYVSFNVVMSYSTSIEAFIATNKIGALFTNTNYTTISPIQPNDFAHVYTDSVISDTANWYKIIGSFIADSAYQKIVIGNFFTDSNTNTLSFANSPFSFSYYYLDDVCVSLDSIFASNYEYLGTNNLKLNNSFEVNFNSESNTIAIYNNSSKPFEVIINNTLGQQLYYENDIFDMTLNVNSTNFNSGVLFLTLKLENQFYQYKLIKP